MYCFQLHLSYTQQSVTLAFDLEQYNWEENSPFKWTSFSQTLAEFKSDLYHLTLLYIQFNLRCLFSSTPLYYLLLPWTKQYIFLSQPRNNLGLFPRHFWREVTAACSSTEEDTLSYTLIRMCLWLLTSVICLIEKFRKKKGQALASFPL